MDSKLLKAAQRVLKEIPLDEWSECLDELEDVVGEIEEEIENGKGHLD